MIGTRCRDGATFPRICIRSLKVLRRVGMGQRVAGGIWRALVDLPGAAPSTGMVCRQRCTCTCRSPVRCTRWRCEAGSATARRCLPTLHVYLELFEVPDLNDTYVRPPHSPPFALSVARIAGEVEAPPVVAGPWLACPSISRSPELWPSMAAPVYGLCSARTVESGRLRLIRMIRGPKCRIWPPPGTQGRDFRPSCITM